jgi:uncharacterized protein DUF1572
MTSDELARATTEAAGQELQHALERIRHCTDQLTDEQVWLRPAKGQNSIANLLLHLAGNVRQWVVVGLGGGEDRRHRPLEFSAEGGQTKGELMQALETTVHEAQQALGRQTAEDLLRARRIQGFDASGLEAIFDSIPHFRGHTQEIVFRTRLLLGDKYRFAWTPQTKEQGAK